MYTYGPDPIFIIGGIIVFGLLLIAVLIYVYWEH